MSDQNQTVQFQQPPTQNASKFGVKKIVLILMIIISLGVVVAIFMGIQKLQEISSGQKKENIENTLPNSNNSQQIEEVARRPIFGGTAITTSTVINEFEGEIIAIDKSAKFDNITNRNIVIRISIKGKGNNPSVLSYTKDELDNVEVMQSINGTEAKISIYDLKVGDNVKAKTVWSYSFQTKRYDQLLQGVIQKI